MALPRHHNAISVLLADSNQTQCRLLVSALRRRQGLRVTSCPVNLETILQQIAACNAQVVAISSDAPRDGWHNLTLVRRLHLEYPEVAKVLLLDRYDTELVISAFRSGVRGLFSLADHPFPMLCRCIQRVRQGQIWANSQQLGYLIEAVMQVPTLRTLNARGMHILTPREEQVVALVADGLSNRAVAGELKLSEHTVKKYLFRIFDKLGISSRVELVLYAVNSGETVKAEWIAGAEG